jgi:hypothetical protein
LRYTPLFCAALAIVSAPVWAQQDEVHGQQRSSGDSAFEVFSGVEFEEGELGAGQKVQQLSVPLGIRVSTGRLRATALLPYTRVTAPGNVVVPSGPLGLPILIDPSRPSEVSSREGIGDLRLGLSYQLPIAGIAATIRSGVKLPTASVADGLGTGETDYSLGADLAKTLGVVTPFAGVSYTVAGDPDNFELQNSVSGQAGAALRLGTAASAHLGYSYAQSASEGAPDEQRLFGGVNTAVGNGIALGLYGSAGLQGAANLGAGVSLGISLD